MPDYSNLPIPQGDWLRFVDTVRDLLGPQADDRPLDQFLQLRDAVLELISSPDFLKGLQEGWPPVGSPNRPLTPEQQQRIENILLLELRAFPAGAEVVAKTGEKSEEARKKLLGRAGVASGSMKDLLDNLPPHAKMGLTALKQLLDVFEVDFFKG